MSKTGISKQNLLKRLHHLEFFTGKCMLYLLLELYPQLVNADKEAVMQYADDLVQLVESGEVDLEGLSKEYT